LRNCNRKINNEFSVDLAIIFFYHNGTMIKEMDKACLDYVSVHVLCLILLELGFSL